MTQNLTTLYRKFYETYSKKYGPNTAVLMLVGKFYELYDYADPITGEPATSMKRAIELMNIALKEKVGHGPNGETALEGGIPEQSLHKFAQILTRESWHVVVVDQVKDAITDTVIDRIPARILGPGTHIETATRDRMTIGAILATASRHTAAVLDITTGEVFSFHTKSADDILHMFQVYCVKEVLLSSDPVFSQDLQSLTSLFGIHGVVHNYPWSFRDGFSSSFTRESYFTKLFRLKTLLPPRTALGLAEPPDEQLEQTLCLLLRFLEDHFPQQTERLASHSSYNPADHMRLSNNILEQLNIIVADSHKRSILSMVEKTHSAIGKRALRERILRPSTSATELQKRWDEVAWASTLNSEDARNSERYLRSLYDIPRLHHRLAESSILPDDVLQMFQSYQATHMLMKELQSTPLASSSHLKTKFSEFRTHFQRLFDEEKTTRRRDGHPSGFLSPLAGPQTAAIETKIGALLSSWQTTWAAYAKEAGCFSEFSLQKKGDGEYVWEGARNSLKSLQAFLFTQSKSSTQLLTNPRVDSKKSGPITFTCKEFETMVDSLQKHVTLLNKTLVQETQVVCDDLWEMVKEFQGEWIEWLGRVDCTFALAAAATEFCWCKPELGDSLVAKGLRHPLLDTAMTRMEYVKHSVALGKDGVRGWLLYGVNASGKSSLMKAVGIAVLLAQAGSFVPADSFTLRPYDAAFSRIWSHDNVWAGLSSFAVEVSELRDILANATEKSLVLGDEVCSGTESSSATALVASTLEHLYTLGTHFMFATHLHDLMKVPGFIQDRPGIAVWHLRVLRTPEGKLIYDRTLQPGSGHCSYGLEVAKAMGLPFSVMERAYEIRRGLEGTVAAGEGPQSSWNSQISREACENCGEAVVRNLEVHHIVPRAEGGGNALRNLVVLCERCHDDHHRGALEIKPLRMTSEGLERGVGTGAGATGAVAATPSPPVEVKGGQRSEEEIQCISAALDKHKGRPLTRVRLELEEQGITITPAQLKRFIEKRQQQGQQVR